MNAEGIILFLQSRWEIIQIVIGVLCVIGAVRDWDWLCDPTGTRQAQSMFGRGGRRLIFGLCGGLLIVLGVLMVIV